MSNAKNVPQEDKKDKFSIPYGSTGSKPDNEPSSDEPAANQDEQGEAGSSQDGDNGEAQVSDTTG